MTTTSAVTGAGQGRSYNSASHGCSVVEGFQRLWQDSSMCDTQLIVQGQTFHVHRCYLAACSQYFYSMFTKDFAEKMQAQVELKAVSALGLRALLEYSYTGSIVINDANLQDVLEAADHLQFNEVLTFCARHLRDELTVDNCLHFLRLAETYGLQECKRDTKAFILDNFVPVSKNEDFKQITAELLCELLADDRLRAPSEMDVFKVVCLWLEGPGMALSLYFQVLSLIRYGLMSAEQVESIYSHPVLRGDACRDVLQAGLSYHMKLFSQPVTSAPHVCKMRAYKDCLVVMGAGYLDNTLCTNMMAAPIKGGQLGPFVSLAPTKDRRYFAAVAVVNDFVYVVGGQTAMAGDGSHATNNAFRYNPRDGKWLQISSMSVPRTHFSLIALPNCLVAVGGKHNRVALNTAEKYDFANNEWTPIPSLQHTLFSHAGCAHGSKVYISGGCPGEDFTDDVWCFDLERPSWQQRSSLNQSRGYHVMVSHASKLYVCAGNTNAGDRHDVTMTECYDIEVDDWTILSSSAQGQSEAPAVKCDGKVFILGGYSWDAHSFQENAQSYNIETDSWELLKNKLPEPMTGLPSIINLLFFSYYYLIIIILSIH
ncbi:hypothetical protein HELRODRAFT_84578 [Helobdella robusta]|uniref:BTB domain-containing protein n=1 Tax=Helobdella robusta TaxID=6412 RepID=T1G5K5_HELRO|nr:hypothetical protein HELRODRAFT_84578 [Helobdella robusta]ESN98498.1 hypothetical protein HELRODRAFT_84578 [Helobdella robusta]